MDGFELKDVAEMVSKIQAQVMFDMFENMYLLPGRELNQYHLHICVLKT